MRVLLFTGKGGVGKTSIAAATALKAAAAGQRTLVMSTDPAHSLADSLGVDLGPDATRVAPNLDAEQIDGQRRLEDHWREIRDYLIELFAWGGVGEIEAEELALLPGLEEIFALVDVKRHVDADAHDLLVIDCAPTAETLRLLSLPDALGWYIERVFPVERAVAKVLRPVLGRMTSLPLPTDHTLGAVDRLYRNMEGVRAVLSDATTTSVRLVVNPERMVVAEARRTYTALSLFGYSVDAVVCNRLLPDDISDPWFDRWKKVQAEHLDTIRDSFAGIPLLSVPLFDDEVVGTAALTRLGDTLYAQHQPQDILCAGRPLTFARAGDQWCLTLSLPFVQKGEVETLRRGDELYVKVGGHTHSVALPAAVARAEVAGASLRDGQLIVRFSPVVAGATRSA